jgi:hypothetical protein
MNPEAPAKIGRYRTEFRVALIALAAPNLALGAWAVLAPHSWFDDFPGGGRHWVSALGPYNEHLSTDVGAFFLAMGVLLLFAGIALDRLLVQAALGALLVFSVPHLIWHLGELGPYGTLDTVLNVFSLSLLVVVPIILLLMLRNTKGEVTYGTR